ncbi:hypothetical protein [Rhizobium herbae]|uniref:Threonine/homoserine/homoserine lactone efflux protein n=1 Tax=Rhizobium herbae TaxID=508661 RepID=A0ABS4EPQ0_9HYPH|nr:hypothetical protein [Rhizobium herbae]MBP1859908.1 threonine/homoserine/homoserine lactone efflux protein [Rhizobium herbae]
MAVRLWRMHENDGTPDEVTARHVYLTTMLNPKALIFGLVLLPAPGDPEFASKLGIFGAMVMTVASIWAVLGALRGREAVAAGDFMWFRGSASG